MLCLRYIWGSERLTGLFKVSQLGPSCAWTPPGPELSQVCSGASPAALRPAAARRQLIPAALEGIGAKAAFSGREGPGERTKKGSRQRRLLEQLVKRRPGVSPGSATSQL